jgi:hypothetical protein
MHRTPRSEANVRLPKSLLCVVLTFGVLITPHFELPVWAGTPDVQRAAGLAHARVVSLSLVEGAVIVRRPGSHKWNRATLDLSLEEGTSIATARNSFAEIQFENGSTLRVGELSRVDFTQMALGPRGGRVDHVKIAFGQATANVAPAHRDEYLLSVGNAAFRPHGKTEFRADLRGSLLRVEVFLGRLEAEDSNQSVRLEKNQVLASDAGLSGPFQITSPIHTDAWDEWVRGRDEQAAVKAYQENAAMDALLNDWSHVVPPPGLFSGGVVDDGF